MSASRREVAEPFAKAWAAGRAAGRIGRPVTECPYDTASEEELARIWASGFTEGREERASSGTALPEQKRARHTHS